MLETPGAMLENLNLMVQEIVIDIGLGMLLDWKLRDHPGQCLDARADVADVQDGLQQMQDYVEGGDLNAAAYCLQRALEMDGDAVAQSLKISKPLGSSDSRVFRVSDRVEVVGRTDAEGQQFNGTRGVIIEANPDACMVLLDDIHIQVGFDAVNLTKLTQEVMPVHKLQ